MVTPASGTGASGTGASGTGARETAARELVAAAGAVVRHAGLVDYLGHCSTRLPGTDRVIVKPKHSVRIGDPTRLRGRDMTAVDLSGRQLEGTDPPPSEIFIHTEIYRARPDVGAVVHTHQPKATLLGVMGAELLPVLHVPSVLVGEVPVATWPCPVLVETPALGGELAAALGQASLCHLQGHGIVSVAADLRLAVLAAIAFEELAEANLTILQCGRTPRVITAEERAQLRGAVARPEGRWNYYLQQVGRSPAPAGGSQ